MVNAAADSVNSLLDLPGPSIVVTCKCGKRTVIDRERVLAMFRRKRWPMGLESAKSRFRCLGCNRKASRIEGVSAASPHS